MTFNVFYKRTMIVIIISSLFFTIIPLSMGATSVQTQNIFTLYNSEDNIAQAKKMVSNGISGVYPFVPQIYNNDDELLIYGNKIVGQSFIPSKSKLNDVNLKLRRIGNPSGSLTVSIYDSLTDSELVSVQKSSDEISSISNWINFDFDDIKVYNHGGLWAEKFGGIGGTDVEDFLFQTFDNQENVDQEWTHCSGFGDPFFSDDISFAQSFKPSKSKISKIALGMGRWGNPPDLIVSIKDDLDGKELMKVSVPSEDVPQEGWLEIDCDDFFVNIGKTYYIVCRTTGGDNRYNHYTWWFGFNDDGQTPYTRGGQWVSLDSCRYYIVCKTSGGDSNNCYAWAVESHEDSYQKGACYKSENGGSSWEEQLFDDMYFTLGEGNGGDKLDQFQHVFSGSGHRVFADMLTAQSFTATKNNLSKVRLLMFANVPPTSKITVSIRKNLDGMDLTSVSRSKSDFLKFDGCPHWYEFDFSDIDTVPGEIYYIVCKSPGSVGNSDYCWGEMMSRSNDYYTQGTAYSCFDGDENWEINDDFVNTDHCFETYYRGAAETPIPLPYIQFFRIQNLFLFFEKLLQNLFLNIE